MRPSTRTVWTSARWAWNATWPYGFSSGNDTGDASFFSSTTSAFLPTSRLPRSAERPRAVAPPRVAHSTTCSARNAACVTVSPSLWASRCSRERSAPRVERIAENRSPLHQTDVSIDSDTGMPYARSAQVGG